MLDRAAGSERVERTAVSPTDELAPLLRLLESCIRTGASHGDPVAVRTTSVVGLWLHRCRDVGGKRPRRGGPDDDRFVRAVEEREAHRQGRVFLLDVAPGELVRADRRAAPRAPLGEPVASVQPAAFVHDRQEAPDVFDVRVGEREVVAAPVHPLAEPDRALGELGRRTLHDRATLTSERFEAVLLDVALRVEAELLLDPDFDPQPLAVEAVLVALVKPAQRLVALEHVFERAAPGRVHGERLVRRDRSVDEAEPWAVLVQRARSARTFPRAPRARGPRARVRHGPACPEAPRTW